MFRTLVAGLAIAAVAAAVGYAQSEGDDREGRPPRGDRFEEGPRRGGPPRDGRRGERGRPPRPPAPEEVFADMDADGDGMVTKEEFLKHHEQHHRHGPPGPPPRGFDDRGPRGRGFGPPGPPPGRERFGERGPRGGRGGRGCEHAGERRPGPPPRRGRPDRSDQENRPDGAAAGLDLPAPGDGPLRQPVDTTDAAA